MVEVVCTQFEWVQGCNWEGDLGSKYEATGEGSWWVEKRRGLVPVE